MELRRQESDDTREDVFKILITSDNHLGFKEKDPVIGDDSFLAFKECLKLYILITNSQSAFAACGLRAPWWGPVRPAATITEDLVSPVSSDDSSFKASQMFNKRVLGE